MVWSSLRLLRAQAHTTNATALTALATRLQYTPCSAYACWINRAISCFARSVGDSEISTADTRLGTRGKGYFSAKVLKDSVSIHSTAIVHPDAIISEDVAIGPFCSVGPGVKLGKGCVLHPNCHVLGRSELGDGCIIHTGAVVGADIPGCTIIGKGNSIGHYAVVGIKCQDLKYKAGDDCHLSVGDNNDIREYVSVHRSSKPSDQTVIGNGNLIMGSCHIAHDCKLGNQNILANGTLLGGHVILQSHVRTGGGVAVHQKCQIDSYAFVAGGSMVVGDVPMYTMVSGDRAEICGLNLEGLRRHDFSDNEIRSIKRAYQRLFMNTGPGVGKLDEKLDILELSEEMTNVPAVVSLLTSVRSCFAEGRRGICHFGRWRSAQQSLFELNT